MTTPAPRAGEGLTNRAKMSIAYLFSEGFHADAAVTSDLLDDLTAARTALAEIAGLRRFNCDCLPAGPDGEPSDEPGNIYCERDVILVSDLLPLLTTHAVAIRGAK